MTGRSTSRPSTGLWTAIITLLLFSTSVRSDSASASNEAAPSPRAGFAENPSGSVTALRKLDTIVEVPSTTLKSIDERPQASLDVAGFDVKIAADNSSNNRLDDHQPLNEPAGKSAKLVDRKVARVEEKHASGAISSPEFSEKEDYVETHELEDENDREPTTPSTKKEIQTANESAENSKEKDVESSAERSDDRDVERTKSVIGISLVNDTNVNYHSKKTAKPSKEDGLLDNNSKDLKSALENATNVIASGDASDIQLEKAKGPKAQVEVVKNSTLPKIQRITDHGNGSRDERKETGNLEAAGGEYSNEFPTIAIPISKNNESSLSKTDNLPLLSETRVETERIDDTKTLLSPRGRTISFGGTNEFVISDNKTRETDEAIGNGLTKEIHQELKASEFKPYPYAKSTTIYPSNGSDVKVPLDDRQVPESTEEASALENTIGQRQQDKKFVVTEPSVVIDNNIQQFKPAYFKRSGNASRIQSTVDPTSSTTVSINEAKDTNVSDFVPSTKSNTLESNVTDYAENLRVASTENDVPRGKDEEINTSSIGIEDTSAGLDLTGNGITEFVGGAKNYSILSTADDGVTEASFASTTSATRATEDTQVQNSTEKITTLSGDPTATQMDVQTDTEDSMMKISPFNVTEESTRIPTTESVTSFGTSSTVLPTMAPMSSNSSNLPESENLLTTIVPDLATDLPSRETLQFEESSTVDSSVESTTAKIEYEFVGLTETTVSQRYIASSESSNALKAEGETASSTVSSISEFLTASSPITNFGMSTTIGDSTIEAITTKYGTDDQENSTETETSITESFASEDSTTSMSTLDFSSLEEATTSIDGSSDLTTIADDSSTTEINEYTESTTDDVSVATGVNNVTDISVDDGNNTTDTGRAVDSSSTGIPDASDATRETSDNYSNVIIDSTQSTNLSITTETSRVVDTTKILNIDNETNVPSTENTTTPEPEILSTSQDTINNVTAIPTREAVPSLVRIVFEGNWADVCPHLPALRQSLADLLTSGLEKSVLANQIIYQKNPCTDGYAASAMTSEPSVTSLLLYVVDAKGNFDEGMTKILPTLYSKSPIKLQVTIHSFQLVQDSDSGNAIAVVVVSCVALICLVLLAALLFIMRKRQTRFNYGERCRPVSLDAYSLDNVSACNSVRRKGAARASKRSYGNPTFEDSSAIPSHPLNFGGLATFCNEQNAISEEFTGIPQVTARIDELPPGAEVKNRYANVVPLPETRVSLMKINNDPLTEYINASYVRGPKNATKYYIACQAPIESTVTDFWRMIWEQQSKVIIMLTDLVENGVEKCAEYIPPSEVTDCHRLFGDFQVTLKKRETKEKYAISTLHLKNLENNTFREISHIWYLWPANGVQSDAAGLIAVLLEARALQRGGPGPIVVHCSPGTGRTGTLIALDLGIRQYEITRTVDVPRVVYTIRRDRAGAVQTKEQYAFIYKALNLYATKLAGGALES